MNHVYLRSALTLLLPTLVLSACGGSQSQPAAEASSGGGVRFENYESGSSSTSYSQADYGGAELDDYSEQEAPMAAMPMSDTKPVAQQTKMAAVGGAGSGTPQSNQSQGMSPPQDTQEGSASEPQGRMVYYSGQARIRVTKPSEEVERAIAIAKKNDGFVEQRSDTHVTLRVPVAQFETIFDELLELGDIDDHSVSAQDITDRYTAVELRLKVLSASRDRFMQLLAKAKTEQEKLSLLAQIKRLTEQLDRLQIESNTLKSLADYSRIHLRFVPRSQLPSGPVHEPVVAFRWIYQLSPFAATRVTDDESYLEFVAPEGFVLFTEDDDRWRAESANGAVVWTYARENEPRGDSKFWLDTIDHRVSKSYDSSKRERIGQYEVLKLVDGSRQGYRFWIAVRAADDELHIVHVYFPSEQHEKRFLQAVRSAFEAAKGVQ